MEKIIDTFEGLSLVLKVVLLIFLGGIIAPAYRIIKYLLNKNTNTLIAGLICCIPAVGSLVAIIDIITEVTSGKITVFAD